MLCLLYQSSGLDGVNATLMTSQISVMAEGRAPARVCSYWFHRLWDQQPTCFLSENRPVRWVSSSLSSQCRLKLYRAARGVFSAYTEPSRRNRMWVNGRRSLLFLPNYLLVFTNISQFGHVAAVVFIHSDTEMCLSDMMSNINSHHTTPLQNKSHTEHVTCFGSIWIISVSNSRHEHMNTRRRRRFVFRHLFKRSLQKRSSLNETSLIKLSIKLYQNNLQMSANYQDITHCSYLSISFSLLLCT